MKTLSNRVISLSTLAVPLALLTACGGNNARQLETISVTPAVAKASGGSVQFSAAGHYDGAPYTVDPLKTTWSYTGPTSNQIVLTQDGVATCQAGKPGTVTVAAWIEPEPGGPVCNVIGPGGAPCESIAGTATLTCP